jgi:RHS repeat-associated protein
MTETYTYSADGKRRQKVSASGTTNFVWDEENVLAEQDQNGVTQAQYTQLPGIWGGLVSQRRSGVSSYYGFDLAGNTRALLSPAAVITDSYSYKAFGPELASTGTTTNPHRYCGRLGYYRDNASRQYVRARHLRVDTGRWMSCDPAGFGGGDWNLYRYVGNRPLMRADPSGTQILIFPGPLLPHAPGKPTKPPKPLPVPPKSFTVPGESPWCVGTVWGQLCAKTPFGAPVCKICGAALCEAFCLTDAGASSCYDFVVIVCDRNFPPESPQGLTLA